MAWVKETLAEPTLSTAAIIPNGATRARVWLRIIKDTTFSGADNNNEPLIGQRTRNKNVGTPVEFSLDKAGRFTTMYVPVTMFNGVMAGLCVCGVRHFDLTEFALVAFIDGHVFDWSSEQNSAYDSNHAITEIWFEVPNEVAND